MRLTLPLLVASLTGFWLVAAPSPEQALPLDDFEVAKDHWTFSSGGEFPGAKGSFARAPEAAHEGKFGGRLNFDFSGGGHYVAAILKMPDTATTNWNSLQLWVRRPAGNTLTLRYADPTGQTFQKAVDCAGDRWARLTIPFANWTGHWGGANDGTVRGQPKTLALLIDNGELTKGSLDFDDLRLVRQESVLFRAAYPAYRFESVEGWRTRSEGIAGATKLEGKTWTLDFSQGARSLSLAVPDHTLIGSVEKIHVQAKGSAKGHPVRLIVHTHFMTFHKVIGEFGGEGEQELVTDGPPGPGWEWYGGENDGKLHGPLRLTNIQLAGNDQRDHCTLEMLEVRIDAACPPEKQYILTASASGADSFTATVKSMTGQMPTGQVSWVMRSWDGKELRKGSSLAAGAMVPPMMSLQVPRDTGLNFIEAEFSLEVPGQDIPPAQAVSLIMPLEQGDAALQPESPFGMGVYLCRYGGDAKGLETMERAAQMARKAGVKWSREDFSWSRLEPRRGQFDWTYFDNLVACAKRNGITVYGILGYWSGWTKPYSKEGIDDYFRYVQATVRHYQKDIKQWEIWNEPNIFFWQGPKEMYAELLIRSHAAIKEIDPDAQVLGLSTAGIDNKFIDQMLALKTPFDILTIHPYRRVLKDDEFIADLKKVSDKVKLPDGRRRPVWLTEMGWATFTPHNALKQDFVSTTLRAQAELIARSYLCAIVSGVEPRTFWYDFRNDGDDPVYFEHQMGILYNDFRPKPAYLAYATLARVLKNTVLDGPVAVGPGTFAYSFKPANKSAGHVIALWNAKETSEVSLPTAVKQVSLVNTIGETRPLPVVNGRVAVSLSKGAPVYLLWP